MRQLILSLLAFSITSTCCWSQNLSSLEDAFDQGQYSTIIEALQGNSQVKNDKSLVYLRGRAYTELGMTSRSLSDLARARTLGVDDNLLNLYIAKTYHREGKYQKAIQWYKTYLTTLKKKERNRQEEVFNAISQCVYAQSSMLDPDVILEIPNGSINTVRDELRPVFSRSASNVIYFSEHQHNTTSINGASFSDDVWERINLLPSSINAKGSNMLYDLSGDGQVLFFESAQDGKVYSLYNKKYKPEKNYFFQAPYFPHLGDCDLQIVDDKTIVFASRRPDSYGGYDLYISKYMTGLWSEPKNLGPNVNSQFDERSPFLTSDGKKVYFSSNRAESLGGFDVFRCELSRNKYGWTTPANLKAPINSPADDLHFRVDGNGLRSCFSSNRSTTQGGFDIIVAYFNKPVSTAIVDASHLEYIKYEVDSQPQSAVAKVDSQNKTSQVKTEKSSESSVASTNKKKEEAKVRQPINTSPVKQGEEQPSNIGEQSNKNSKKVEDIAEAGVDQIDKSKQQAKEERQSDPAGILVSEKEKRKPKSTHQSRYTPDEDLDLEEDFEELKSNTIEIPTLYYSEESDLFDAGNTEKLDFIVNQVKKLPKDVTVEITNYTHKAARREYELFFAINQADLIVDYLEDNGIKKERLIVNSVGSSYPKAHTMLGGKENPDHVAVNQRIEFVYYNTPRQYALNYEDKELPHYAKSRKYDLFRTVKDEVHYRIQFAETSHVFKNIILSYYDDIIITRDYKFDRYIYSVGFLETYREALELQKKLEQKNLKDTKIKPYLGSVPLTMKKAIDKSSEYPNLRPYINAN